MTKTDIFLGWHEAGPAAAQPPTLLATLRAPKPRRTLIQIYSDGSLAYQFLPNPKWIPSRLSVYSGVGHGRLGRGENLTPEQFIARHEELGYTRVDHPSA